MCVVSMVHDHYQRRFDHPFDHIPNPIIQPLQTKPLSPEELGEFIFKVQENQKIAELEKQVVELRKLVEEFQAAKHHAEEIDRLTGQPDCVDPAKATLTDRVAALEARLGKLEAFIGMNGK